MSAEENSKTNSMEAQIRFFKFIEGWVTRYNRWSDYPTHVGEDFVIDFNNKAVHPLNDKGKDFVAFVKGEAPRLGERPRIIRYE